MTEFWKTTRDATAGELTRETFEAAVKAVAEDYGRPCPHIHPHSYVCYHHREQERKAREERQRELDRYAR